MQVSIGKLRLIPEPLVRPLARLAARLGVAPPVALPVATPATTDDAETPATTPSVVTRWTYLPSLPVLLLAVGLVTGFFDARSERFKRRARR